MFITVIAAGVAFSAVSARVGETKQEIDVRYGAGEKSNIQRLPGAETFKYLKNNFQIEVVMLNGKSIWEIFQRKDKLITDDDIKDLLKANVALPENSDANSSKSSSWTEPNGETKRTWYFNRQKQRWERSGKPRFVAYRWPGHEDYFCIKDVEACDAQEAKAQGVSGF